MLNTTKCQSSAQSYKQLRSYKHFKIRAYISLKGRMMAEAEMLLILKLNYHTSIRFKNELEIEKVFHGIMF